MEPSTVTNNAGENPQANRKQLTLVLVMFLGPLLAAILLYATADRWMSGDPTAQHGHLYQPVRTLEALPLTGLDGKALSLADLRGKWSVVVIGSGDCPATCREALYKVRQAHKAQGKNIGRVQRLFVALGGAPGDEVRNFLKRDHPHLKVATPSEGKKALSAFKSPQEQGPAGIYVVDPHANLVLRYGFAAGAEGILEDLDHLLKHSTIG